MFAGFLYAPTGKHGKEKQHHTPIRVSGTTPGGRSELELMSEHERDDFPPHWDHPPRPAYRETKPSVLEVMVITVEKPHATWVRQLFLKKFQSEFVPPSRYGKGTSFERLSHEDLNQFIFILGHREKRFYLFYLKDSPDDSFKTRVLTTLLKQRIADLYKQAIKRDPELAAWVGIRNP